METLGHRRLDSYLKDKSAASLARAASLSEVQISHLVRRRRKASFEVAHKIEKATDGFIQAEDWLKDV